MSTDMTVYFGASSGGCYSPHSVARPNILSLFIPEGPPQPQLAYLLCFSLQAKPWAKIMTFIVSITDQTQSRDIEREKGKLSEWVEYLVQ